MNIEKIISIVSILIWFIPPAKQHKTEYFLFFIILAVADPIMLFFLFLVKISPQIISVFILFALIGSLLRQKKLFFFLAAFISLCILIYPVRTSNHALLLVNAIGHLTVFLMIISRVIDYINDKHLINLFLILLTMYELMSVLKILVVITDIVQGVAQFYLATVFQILFGILFSLFSFDDKRFDIAFLKNK